MYRFIYNRKTLPCGRVLPFGEIYMKKFGNSTVCPCEDDKIITSESENRKKELCKLNEIVFHLFTI